MTKRIPVMVLVAVLAVCLVCCGEETKRENVPAAVNGRIFKILHVASYHEGWEWPEHQFAGFKDELKNLDVEYKVFYMDTKRKSSEDEMRQAGEQARQLIDSWKPDLVFTTDDNAQEYVTKYYINTAIPFVCSGVNGEPAAFGFTGSGNIAGILERELSIETIKLLRELVPGVKRIAVISDPDRTWPPIFERMKKRAAKEMPEIEFVAWDIVFTYYQYQQKILSYATTADAVIHLGDFAYKDETGNANVPFEELEKWTVKNSLVPDASFWEDRVRNGYLVAIIISGYEQGKNAGLIARQILVSGKNPADFGFTPTSKGQPVINLARARDLNIRIRSDILLSAKVFNDYEWEKK